MSKSNLSCAIVGLPNVGKSTLFNALIKKNQAKASNRPFCTIDPNIGVVDVPDPRLQTLAKLSNSKKITPATLTFIDVAGLIEGASKGEGLGNQFLSHIREANAIIHVVRCFEDNEVTHVSGKVDPMRDIELINSELILADLQMSENIIQKASRQARGHPQTTPILNTLKQVYTHLNDNKPVRSLELGEAGKKHLSDYHFITAKKIIYAVNLSEKALLNPEATCYHAIEQYALKTYSQAIPFSAKLEAELALLSGDAGTEYLHAFGLQESGLTRLIKTGFASLGLITFLTTGEKETRAWTITKHTTAREAAGKIHNDIKERFVRAEVITFDDMYTYKGRVHAKAAGKARLEGRDYIIQDGDVILFLHHH